MRGACAGALLFLLGALAACGSTPPSHFYTLSATAKPGTTSSA